MELYDTIIIGGGPAGAAAAVYAARKKLRTLMIVEEFGGKSIVSSGIQNWLGEVNIAGLDLADKLEKHVRAQKEVELVASDVVTRAELASACSFFSVHTREGRSFQGKTLIVASGARRRRLNVPGEQEYAGRGVAYCSICDAPFFQDMDVAVVGGGNAALETAVDLTAYARTIFLLIRRDSLRGDPVTQDKVLKSPQAKVIPQAEVVEIGGDKSVTSIRYRDLRQGVEKTLDTQGVFIAIGSEPNTEFIRDLVDTNPAGEIIINCKTAQTSRPGIFAAGDVTDDPFKQNNIAAGDGVKAALSAYNYLLEIRKYSPCSDQGAAG